VKLRPFDIGARNSLGAALIRQGRFDEAVQELKEALQRQPDSAEAHFHLGVALAAQRHHDEAVAELRRTLELEPGYADAKQQLEKLQAGSTAH
jgi:Flp pilus assembly protein TadD